MIHAHVVEAKYTVRVSKLLLRNCVQANDDTLEVLPHIIPYLSTRRSQIIGSRSHVNHGFSPLKNGLDILVQNLLKFQFQFFTLNLENSDKTKSLVVDCDRANLD